MKKKYKREKKRTSILLFCSFVTSAVRNRVRVSERGQLESFPSKESPGLLHPHPNSDVLRLTRFNSLDTNSFPPSPLLSSNVAPLFTKLLSFSHRFSLYPTLFLLSTLFPLFFSCFFLLPSNVEIQDDY